METWDRSKKVKQPEITRSADISPCLQYRYVLGREWNPERQHITWCMLNPSTADHRKDDPTIRQCIFFSRRWGYGRLSVVNLFAYRASKPFKLLSISDPVGPDNELYLKEYLKNGPVVAAWGSSVRLLRSIANEQIALVHEFAGDRLWTFGLTREGHPRHPLYLPFDTPLVKLDRT